MSTAEKIEVHLTGSSSVEGIGGVTGALRVLLDALTNGQVVVQVESRCVCDGCGLRSSPVDLSQPAETDAALGGAGWVRYAVRARDTCPTCATQPGDPS